MCKILEKREGNVPLQVKVAKKPRKNINKVVGGKAMTEDTVYMKVQDYINEQNTKSKGTPTKAAAPKTSKEKKSVAPKYSKGKTVSKKTKIINSIAEPIPGTSGLSSKIGLP